MLLMIVLLVSILTAGCGDEGSWALEYPLALLGLGVVPLLAWQMTRRDPLAIGFSRGDDARTLGQTLRTRLRTMPTVLRLCAVTLAIIACARPQIESTESRSVEGVDLFLALDLSGSMAAVDMSAREIRTHQTSTQTEPPNRFQNAIATLKTFVAARERDRIGMVVFARDAYLQFPLTLDTATIQSLLDDAALEMIDPSATAIGNALGIGVRGLLDSEAESRAIILITDGKQQGGNISPVEAAELAADEGILLYTILVGREGPAMVPTNRTGRYGRHYVEQNYPVDPELLAEIAEITGGTAYRAENRAELERDLNAILDDLERTATEDVASVRETEMAHAFILLALGLLLFEALLAHLVIRRFP